MSLLARLLLVLLTGLFAPLPAAATESPLRLAFSADFTGSVVRSLETGAGQCQAIPAIYRFDCQRQNFRRAARSLNGKPDYRDAQKALRHVENALKDVVRTYGDKSTPSLRTGGRTYKPVQAAALKSASAAFDKARAEAVTILLRSDGEARPHYEKIAAAVGSNKMIIRSAIGLLRRLA